MRNLVRMGLLFGAASLAAGAQAVGHAEPGPNAFSAELVAYQEVPANASQAVGAVTLAIDDGAGTIAYRLSFSGLEGSVLQSHIHFAQSGVSGGIMVWLCGTATNPGPAGTPVCPVSGEVSGMLGPAEVVGPTGQGIAAGDFDKVVAAIRGGVAYANVHTTKVPAGEIRGQLRPGGGHQ